MKGLQIIFIFIIEISSIQCIDEELNTFMKETNTEILQMKEEMRRLGKELDVYKNIVKTMAQQSHGKLLEDGKASGDLQTLRRQSNDQLDRTTHVRHKRRDYVSQELKVVAFQSYITRIANLHIYAGSQIVFDTVRTNIGNGYNRINGVFTAPKAGCYVFTWHIRCESCNIPTKLFARGAIAGSINAISSDTEYDSPTGISVVSLSKGDPVFVRVDSGFNPTGGFKSNHWHYSTFSGWLVG